MRWKYIGMREDYEIQNNRIYSRCNSGCIDIHSYKGNVMSWLIGLIIVAIAIVSGLLFAGFVAIQIALDEWKRINEDN